MALALFVITLSTPLGGLVILRRVPCPPLLTRLHVVHRGVPLDAGAGSEHVDAPRVHLSIEEIVQLLDTLVMHHRLLFGGQVGFAGFPLGPEGGAGQVEQPHVLLDVDVFVPFGDVALELGPTLDHASLIIIILRSS